MSDVRISARQQRLRAALRDNLKKRKSQMRGRLAAAAMRTGEPDPGAGGQAEPGEIAPTVGRESARPEAGDKDA